MESVIVPPESYLHVKDHLPLGWEEFFISCENDIYTRSVIIASQQMKGATVLPYYDEVFTAFHLTQPTDVKVVIFGQDPYATLINGKSVGHGLAFSTREEFQVPRSLINIYSEIKRCYPESTFANGNLTQWAHQGVLLLNISLTVNKGEPGSHDELWVPFIKKVVEYICSINPGTIFVLWGAPAKKIGEKIIPSGKTKLIAPHPVAYGNKFAGNMHFKEINDILKGRGDRLIDWSIYPSL